MLAFAALVDYGVGGGPQAVVSADFNDDAIADLAVPNYSAGAVNVDCDSLR